MGCGGGAGGGAGAARLLGGVVLEVLRVDPAVLEAAVGVDRRVAQGAHDGQVRVRPAVVLAHDRDGHLTACFCYYYHYDDDDDETIIIIL